MKIEKIEERKNRGRILERSCRFKMVNLKSNTIIQEMQPVGLYFLFFSRI